MSTKQYTRSIKINLFCFSSKWFRQFWLRISRSLNCPPSPSLATETGICSFLAAILPLPPKYTPVSLSFEFPLLFLLLLNFSLMRRSVHPELSVVQNFIMTICHPRILSGIFCKLDFSTWWKTGPSLQPAGSGHFINQGFFF